MRRIGRTALSCVVALLAIGFPTAKSDEKPRPSPQAVDPVDRILEEWQAKASTIKSVEVRFKRSQDDPVWGNHSRWVGRAVLATPNLALIEEFGTDANGKATSLTDRMIWNGESIFWFNPEKQDACRIRLSTEWTRPPRTICLPFFFGMTVEEAKRDYDWTLIGETLGVVLLKAEPKVKPGSSPGWQTSFIYLDRKTYLPKRLILRDRVGRETETYDSIEIKLNAVEALDELLEPCLDAWTVSEGKDSLWPIRLFLK